MLERIRLVSLILGLAACMAAPVTPAFAGSAPCAMPGCEDSGAGLSALHPCCCGASEPPAESGRSGLSNGLAPRACETAPTVSTLDLVRPLIPAGALAGHPPDPPPLYLLDGAFLM